MTLSLLWVAGIFISSCNIVSMLSKSDKDVSSAGTLYQCGKSWIHNGQYSYFLESTPMSWENAACHCSRKGGNLASIHTQEEQDFLACNILREAPTGWWIGLHDITAEGEYFWEDRSNVDYTSWRPGEPTGHKDGREDCVVMWDAKPNFGSWNDADCTKLKAFICKKHVQRIEHRNESEANSSVQWIEHRNESEASNSVEWIEHRNESEANISAPKTHGNQERSNNSGYVSVTTFIIILTVVTVLVVQMGAILHYRRLWLDGKREKLGPVVFNNDVPNTILSTEVDIMDEDTQTGQKYSLLH